MRFCTERLVIRPFECEDVNDVFEIYRDEETCRFLLHGCWVQEDVEERFAKKLGAGVLTKESGVSLAVVFGNRVIGDLSVWYTGMRDTVEVGYSFNAGFSGRGFASEAVGGLVERLFDEFGVHRVQATLDARNRASQRVCERIRMRREGHFLQDFWNKGEWTDSMVYGMLAQDRKEERNSFTE